MRRGWRREEESGEGVRPFCRGSSCGIWPSVVVPMEVALLIEDCGGGGGCGCM